MAETAQGCITETIMSAERSFERPPEVPKGEAPPQIPRVLHEANIQVNQGSYRHTGIVPRVSCEAKLCKTISRPSADETV
jgi:hypothetical protein